LHTVVVVTQTNFLGGEFLSDAPFFGLSLCMEFQLANCTCASGWSCLMNFDLKFHPGLEEIHVH